MEGNVKVGEYLEFLRAREQNNNNRTADFEENQPEMLRGPGQKGQDPFQFVSTKGGEDLAVEAKNVLNIAQQQKVQYNKMLESRNTQKFVEHEPWQADLDTWRRKRKDRLVKPDKEEIKEKDQILRIASPNTEDSNNDSGIENRAAGSPSTSLDFSPRSSELLISPKSEHDSALGTPSPQSRTSRLDQVLIPLQVQKSRSSSTYEDLHRGYELNEPISYVERTRKVIETMPVVKSSTNAYVEASFKEPIRSQRFKEISTTKEDEKTDENIELTVELNREQKATVTASKFPRNQPMLTEKAPEPKTPPPTQTTTVHRIYHAVDIPFDESPVTYAPRKHAEDGIFTLAVEMGSYPMHKGFGMSSSRRDGRYVVDSVIVGSPADRAGFLVGDEIVSIDGVELDDKFESAYHRMIQDAARNGDANIQIRRRPVITHNLPKQSSFDKARSIFNESKNSDSYADFKRRHSRGSSTSSRSSRDFNSLPRNATQVVDRKRDNSLSSYRTTAEEYESRHHTVKTERTSDYRVTSLHDRGTPGKLSNFVPEVDRSHEDEFRRGPYSDSREEPTLIRNYRLSNGSNTRVNVTVDSRRPSEEETVDATLRRATLPRKGKAWEEEDLKIEGLPVAPAPRSRSQLAHREERRYFSAEEGQIGGGAPIYASLGDVRKMTSQRKDYFSIHGRNRVGDDVSRVTHRFYDRDGNHVAGRRDASTDVEIQREYGRYEYRRRREEERMKELDQWESNNYFGGRQQEQRNWRGVINEQRHATPGLPGDGRGLAAHNSDLQNLPTFINRRLEQREQEFGGYGAPVVEKYQREEYNRHEEGTHPGANSFSNTGYRSETKEEVHTEERREDNVVAVSGKHKCSHCREELGRGAAMIIESLSLFYHLNCFKCYVCKTSLGSGSTGTDVRVRDGRLHCQRCYSNDKVKLSKV